MSDVWWTCRWGWETTRIEAQRVCGELVKPQESDGASPAARIETLLYQPFYHDAGNVALTTCASSSSRLVGWWDLTAVGENIPVKLNIRWDRIAAICLCRRSVQTSCVVLETPSCLSEGEVCLKSRNQKTKKIKHHLDQRTKWVWRSQSLRHHQSITKAPSVNL